MVWDNVNFSPFKQLQFMYGKLRQKETADLLIRQAFLKTLQNDAKSRAITASSQLTYSEMERLIRDLLAYGKKLRAIKKELAYRKKL